MILTAELSEAESNQKLLKPFLEVFSPFGLTQLINKPTRSSLKTSSLLDQILKNSNESLTQHGITTLGISDHDLIFCTRKIKCFKSSKRNTISVRTYKNHFKRLLEQQLTKMKFRNYSGLCLSRTRKGPRN